MVALAVALQAHRSKGTWLLRIEDVDTTRIVPGSETSITTSLAAHGFQWQEPVLHQSERSEYYERALQQLLQLGLAFPCACSRTDLPPSGIYAGRCRDGLLPDRTARSFRLRVPDIEVIFQDQVMGLYQQRLAAEVGDFVIRRADGCYAYQLAVVLDDAEQGITEVVRGADLLDSTPRQIYLQQCLGLAQPTYLHLPLLLGEDGRKLSKRNFSNPIRDEQPMIGLRLASALLGHRVPSEIETVENFWEWANLYWNPGKIPRQNEIYLGQSEPAVILKHLQQENIL